MLFLLLYADMYKREKCTAMYIEDWMKRGVLIIAAGCPGGWVPLLPVRREQRTLIDWIAIYLSIKNAEKNIGGSCVV